MSQGLPNLENAFSTIAAPARYGGGALLVRSVRGATLAQVLDHYKEVTGDVAGSRVPKLLAGSSIKLIVMT